MSRNVCFRPYWCSFLGLVFVVAALVFLNRVDVSTFVDHAALTGFVSAYAIWLSGWLLVFLLGLAFRSRPRAAHTLVTILPWYYALPNTIVALVVGPYTTDIVGGALVAGGVLAILVFEWRQLVLPLICSVVIFVIGTVAEQARWIPYAPIFSASPMSDGQLARSFVLGIGGMLVLFSFITGGIIGYFLLRLREREDRLGRAGLAIGRYVPAQVAEAILEGRDELVNTHARRKLTIFFSDLVGFTEIAERMEPEDLSRLLNEYFTEMTAIAERHNGTVDELIGDAVLILFGAPQATSDADHALRSVRMAIEMQQSVDRLNSRWRDAGIDETFRVRMGINTGVVTIGNFGSAGRVKYTALGKHVNLAARLQASCEPGKILLSQTTWLLVRDQIQCVQKDEVQLKGIQRPVQTHEVAVSPFS